VMLFTSAINGTQAGITTSLSVYSDSATGTPNAVVGGPVNVSNLAAGWWEWPGINMATTQWAKYWFVTKNLAASPTANYPTFRWVKDVCVNGGMQNVFCKMDSTNSGSAWGTVVTGVCGLRIEYTDGTFKGIPLSNATNDTSYASYGNIECGSLATSPDNCRLEVIGVIVPVRKTGTPTGSCGVRLRYGSTVVTSNKYLTGVVSSAANTLAAFYFPTIQYLDPGTPYRVTVFDDASDGSSNYFYTMGVTIQDSTASKLLVDSVKKTATANGGSSFVETNTSFMPYTLILNSPGEFSRMRNKPVIGGSTVVR
jgi:hypothetical protein